MRYWHNKDMLERFKGAVQIGHHAQKEYDKLENQMNTFNLDYDLNINKAIDYLMSIEPGAHTYA